MSARTQLQMFSKFLMHRLPVQGDPRGLPIVRAGHPRAEPREVILACADLAQRLGTISSAPERDLMDVVRRHLARCLDRADYAALPDRWWPVVPHVLLADAHGPEPPPLLLDELEHRIARPDGTTRRQVRLIQSAISAYLLGFSSTPTSTRVGAAINAALEQQTNPRLGVWQGRSKRFDLFVPRIASRTLAGTMFVSPAKQQAILADAGLSGQHATGPLAWAARQAYLNRMAEQSWRVSDEPPNDLEPHLSAIAGWGRPDQSPLRATIISSIVHPWLDRSPPMKMREGIAAWITRYYGDPRVGDPRWYGVGEKYRSTVVRWLVRTTIEEFFDVLDTTSDRETWQHRRAFWHAYIRAGHVDDAWLALGSSARRRVEPHKDKFGGFGELVGGSSDQSALLMRVRNLVICEWSSVGKCRIWRETEGGTPRLLLSVYRAVELRQPTQANWSHIGGATGRWQGKIADYIHDRTNIVVSAGEHSPHVFR